MKRKCSARISLAGHFEVYPMRAVLEKETLPRARTACRILPAALGEQIGDYAALAIAKSAAERDEK